jgi:predicted DNA-binding transcriptional regulator YafY
MTKSNRLFDIMQVLRRHRTPVAGTALAREAGVSLRTIYRYIAALQAMGAEIDGEPGVGYVLRPTFLLPPLMFSEQELHAIALGAQWVTRQTDPAMALAADDVLGKIGAVLPADLRHILHDNAFHVGRRREEPQSVDLQIIRQAMREQRKLFIGYRNPNGTATERTIWPISLGFVEARRFVAGWCELRHDFRLFRIDRIEHAELTTERYPGRRRDLVKQWRSQVAEDERSNATP